MEKSKRNENNNSPTSYDKLLIKSLKLTGNYKVLIKLTIMLKLPDMRSDHNYISIPIPNHFNMTVLLYPERLCNMEIFTENGTFSKHIQVNNNSRIEFYDIKASHSLRFVPVLLKNPEITVNAHTSIKNANFNGACAWTQFN